jgi:hypothetical protein
MPAATPLGQAAEWIRDQLLAVDGLDRVVLDLEDVNPPCVLVVLDTVEHRILSGVPYLSQWHLFLVGQRGRATNMLDQLDQLHQLVRAEFQSSTPVEAQPLAMPGQGDPLPTLHMTVRIKVEGT